MHVCICGLLWCCSGKKLTCQCRRYRGCERHGFNPLVEKIAWSRKKQPILVLLPGKFHGQRSLAGYSPGGHRESDTTEQLTTYTYTHTCIYIYITHYVTFIHYVYFLLPINKKLTKC